MSANKCYLFSLLCLCLGPGFQAGYVVSYQNQLATLFEVKFGWTGTDKDVREALLGGAVMLGMTIGALIGGILMKIGRRRSMFICLAIGIAGNLISIKIDNFYMLTGGRFLYGLSSGLYTPIIPKFLEETLPSHLFATSIGVWGSS